MSAQSPSLNAESPTPSASSSAAATPSAPSDTATPPRRPLKIVGGNTLVEVGDISDIPAKIDTGADSSSIWASDITLDSNNHLVFTLLAPGHPLYTGEQLTSSDYSIRQVRNSTGDTSIRYVVPLVVKIRGRKIRTNFTLADRAKNKFPILIGRKTIQGKFLVDVSKASIPRPATFDNNKLNQELKQDPKSFHEKYMK